MRAKQIYEFQQGLDPYKAMGLGNFKVGERVEIKYDLEWDTMLQKWYRAKTDDIDLHQGDYWTVKTINILLNDWANNVYILVNEEELGVLLTASSTLINANENDEKWLSNKEAMEFLERL
jgi:hypothetical protein